jgi:hypothetical protein
MATPHTCPVCLGTMQVPGGFYGVNTTSTVLEKCRSCENGIVWDYNQDTIKTKK